METLEPMQYRLPATMPMMTAAQGCTVEQPLVMATRPASAPFAHRHDVVHYLAWVRTGTVTRNHEPASSPRGCSYALQLARKWVVASNSAAESRTLAHFCGFTQLQACALPSQLLLPYIPQQGTAATAAVGKPDSLPACVHATQYLDKKGGMRAVCACSGARTLLNEADERLRGQRGHAGRAAGDSVVVTAAVPTELEKPMMACWLPGLNPYQPNQRIITPSTKSELLWPGKVLTCAHALLVASDLFCPKCQHCHHKDAATFRDGAGCTARSGSRCQMPVPEARSGFRCQVKSWCQIRRGGARCRRH